MALDTASVTILNLGCGRIRTAEQLHARLFRSFEQEVCPIEEMSIVNLDGHAHIQPDLVCRLGIDPIALADDSVDVAVALHVLEHIGQQGSTTEWFAFWRELYRVLKPTGQVLFECPYHTSIWAWADPTHSRAISEHTFWYLSQLAYQALSAIPDYRPPFDFRLMSWGLGADEVNRDIFLKEGARSWIRGVLHVRKPLVPYWETRA